ncbi:hypothetical protein BKA70DRAFT_1416831 [Coprinopsis sp. MPI-PUGE-AT-0042]|nr:hypothetical protein BKA70DRAFT_1416831 [Coprinopsis sp. MPI-PUGE-AT-0042]
MRGCALSAHPVFATHPSIPGPSEFSWEPGHVTRSDGHSVRRPFFLLRRRHQPLTTSPPARCRHLACTVGISQQRPFVTPPSAPSSSPPLPSSPPPSLVVVVVVVAACHRPLPPPSPASPTAAHRLHRRLLQPPSPSPSAVASPPPPPSTTSSLHHLLPPPPAPSSLPVSPPYTLLHRPSDVHGPSAAQPLPRHTGGTSRPHRHHPVTTTSSPSTPHRSFDTKTADEPPRHRCARTIAERDNRHVNGTHGPTTNVTTATSTAPTDPAPHLATATSTTCTDPSRDANDVQGPFPLRQRRARTLPATSQPPQRALTLRATPT